MTTTDTYAGPPTPPPAPSSRRLLRRSRSDRVGAGVAGGLGEYFGLDPVLFRVLFATSAFFGGAGVIAYLLAWAAIPEQGTERAPIDGWVRELRRRRIPFWLVAVVVGIAFWAIAFSWWAPGPVFPILIVLLVLFGVFARHQARARCAPDASAAAPPAADGSAAGSSGAGSASPVDLRKASDAAEATAAMPPARPQPAWLADTHQWIAESREAHRQRRRRAMPVRVATLSILFGTLIVLGVCDAIGGILLPVYFYVTLGIVGLGLLVGLVLRRTPWSVTPLLVPAVIGSIAFAGSQASLHDGFGQREWKPTSALADSYRLAFGQAILDLRSLPQPTSSQTVHVTLAAGQAKLIVPRTWNVTVQANVHIGDLTVDGQTFNDGSGSHHSGGFNYNRTVSPPSGATGAPITIDVHVADGNIDVERR